MAEPVPSRKNFRWAILFLGLAILLAGLQVWNAYSMRDVVRSAEQAVDQGAPKDRLDRENARLDLITKQIANDSKAMLPISLATGLSAAVATLAAIVGAMLAYSTYAAAREKEQQDRLDATRKELQAREQDRQDRLGAALNETLGRLVSTEWRQRVVGAAGLLPFFTTDRADFHSQALTALLAAARYKGEEAVVRQGIRLAVERAVRMMAPELLAEVSWQGVYLPDVNLSGARLAGLDLRDAVLSDARLTGADLADADLTAAQLQGARLDGAVLTDAVLTYADLAGATLARARLSGATLTSAKVLNLDLDEADLRQPGPGWRGVPWDATRNWRQALFDAADRAELERIYGAAVPSLRVLMLAWEIPPMVAGGTWTACYHLVRNLRRRGADVTVVVPWRRDTLLLDPPPFGVDVPVVTLDVEVPAEAVSGGRSWSPYASAAVPAPYAAYAGWSPYGSSSPYGWSPYGSGGALWSGYTAPSSSRYGGPYGSPYGGSYPAYGAGGLSGSILFRLITAFARRLRDYVADQKFDLVHAHDWVTFDAARVGAERLGVPWIAHFHSTEADRQPGSADPLTERIEQAAVDNAARIVAVSEATRRTVTSAYDTAGKRSIDVVPNSLSASRTPTAEMGRFETHRVIFLGRLSRQKGVDRFCEVAERVRAAGFVADFTAYGDGPERWQLYRRGIASAGAIGWDKRGTAFAGASAVLVPSRSEPFGMVVLEAMQHRVPVIYPAESGAAEVLQSGVKIEGGDTQAMAEAVTRLLGNLDVWEDAVRAAAQEIERYPQRAYEDRLIAVWTEAVAASRGASAPASHA
jgi:glycosyltransferase involved in cell wall biosynthesis